MIRCLFLGHKQIVRDGDNPYTMRVCVPDPHGMVFETHLDICRRCGTLAAFKSFIRPPTEKELVIKPQ